METAFYILIYIRTAKGFESFGRFYIGDNEELAHQLFKKLKGNQEFVEENVLQMDLMETKNNLPINIKVMGCTLEQLAENCRIITKDVFKMFVL